MLINAGNSKSGIDPSARNVDINFASLDTLENMKDYTTTIKDKARTEYGRPLSTMTYGLVVVRDTEKEAKEVFQQVVDMPTTARRRTSSTSPCRGRPVRSSTYGVPGALRRGWGGVPAGGHAGAGRRRDAAAKLSWKAWTG